MTLLDIDILIELFRKSEYSSVIDVLKSYRLPNPVFITETSKAYKFRFNSDYEQFEMKRDIAALFDDCSLSENIGGGTKDIILAFHTSQSPFSSDGWGRTWNEDYIHKSYYLIKDESESEIDQIPNNKIVVLNDRDLSEHYVHIAYGTHKDSQQKFFVVLKNEFSDPNDAEFLIEKKFKTASEAFDAGFRLLEETIITDLENQRKKKGRRKR